MGSMTDTRLPAEARVLDDDGAPQAAAAPKPRGGALDGALIVVIAGLATALVALAVWWGYTALEASGQQNLSTPAGRSIEQLKTMIAKSPKDAPLRVRLGEALGTAGRSDEAIVQLQEALKIDPKHTGAWLDLGLIFLDKKQHREAVPFFKKVIDLTTGSEMQGVNQRREVALYYLGVISLEQKKYDDALRYLKGAMRIKRDASDTYLLIAKAYIGKGEPKRAAENLRIALAFDPNFAEAQYISGTLYLKQGDSFAAAQSFRKAADALPNKPEPVAALKAMGPASKWIALANRKLAAGGTADARKDIQVALAIDPKNEPAALVFAGILEKSKDKKGAIEVYKQILTFSPDSAKAKAALKRLGG
jgi:Tfp pilus assembly protein PilF